MSDPYQKTTEQWAENNAVTLLRVAGYKVTPPTELASRSLQAAIMEARIDAQALELGQFLADLMQSNPGQNTMAPAHLFRRLLECAGKAGEALAHHNAPDTQAALLEVAHFAMSTIASMSSGTPLQAVQVGR